MGNEQTLTLTFKVKDDGSVTVDTINKKLSETTGNVESMSRSLSLIKFDSIINLGERAFRAGEQIYHMAKSIASATNDIERQAGVIGVSTALYQKLTFAAKMSDVGIEDLGIGIKMLSRTMADAVKGAGDASGLFESLGLSAKGAKGGLKPIEEMLGDIADRFKSMPDGAEKLALSLDLFSRSGERMIPFLNRGRDGIRDLMKEAEKLGIVLNEDVIKKGSQAEDTFKKLEAQINATKLSLAPAALWFANFFADIIKDGKNAADNIEKVAERIRKAQEKARERQEEWRSKRGYPTTSTGEQLGIKGKPPVSIFSYAEENWMGPMEEEAPSYLRQSQEALKAIKAANETIIGQNYTLSNLYDYEANVLRGMAKSTEDRARAMEIMEELGVKTRAGAELEIRVVQKRFQTLFGKGYSPEELEGARKKLEEELKKVQEKYSQPSGWKETEFEEGGIRWHQNIPKAGLTGDVETMVQGAIEDLNRMQASAVAATAPRQMMIDYKPVQSAKEAVEELRKAMESIDGKVITISIDGRMAIDGTTISQIGNALTDQIKNKQSQLGLVLERTSE